MRVLILSDIHANLTALDAVLEDAKDAYDTVWCLGDTVGYGPWPDECVRRVQGLRAIAVIGNHDWAALGRMDVEDFNPEARRAVLWTAEHLGEESRAWLAALPSQPLEAEGYTLTHASPRDPIWEYIMYPSVALANFDHFTTRCCLVGHTHVPALHVFTEGEKKSALVTPTFGTGMTLKNSERAILNPGSVGQPRDNDRRAAYALLDTETGIWEPRRTEYNIERTQRGMRQSGLPERLINRLAFGW
jgi:diadenosine tetraphosphatase ApaH/serine/threonine PP2A family protein phosphatase